MVLRRRDQPAEGLLLPILGAGSCQEINPIVSSKTRTLLLLPILRWSQWVHGQGGARDAGWADPAPCSLPKLLCWG